MVDFHTHTTLCGHAAGTPEEYALEAVKKNISIMGFSDHAPLPEHLRDGVSMHPHEVEDYIALVQTLQKKFSGRLSIRLGFEVDFPLRESFDKKYLTDSRIDYLIGSCHYLEDWPVDHPAYAREYDVRGVDNVYRSYYDALAACAGSGIFNIIGHFDLTKKFGMRPETDMSGNIRTVAEAAARTQTAFEVNTSGLRKPVKEMYPSEEIVKIMFEENVPATLGSDSHRPEDIGADFDKAIAMLKRCGYRKLAVFEKRKIDFIDL